MSESISRQVKTHFLFQPSQRNQNRHTFHLPFNNHTWPIPNAKAHQLFVLNRKRAHRQQKNQWLPHCFVFFSLFIKTFLLLLCIWAILIVAGWEFPSGSVVTTQCFHWWGPSFNPWPGNEDPASQRKEENSCRSLEGMEKITKFQFAQSWRILGYFKFIQMSLRQFSRTTTPEVVNGN